MVNLNYIITKQASDSSLVVIEPTNIIDPSDLVQINFSLVDFANPSSVKISLEFSNGSVINNTYLYASTTNPTIFTYDLTEAVNRNINYGESELITITSIEVADEIKSYTNSKSYSLKLYKSNTSDTFTPDDKQKLYIAINDLQLQINKLKGE